MNRVLHIILLPAKKFSGFSLRSRVLILIAIILLGFGFSRTPLFKSITHQNKNNLKIESLVKSDIRKIVSASGNIESKENVSLHFQSGGRIAYLAVKKNDSVFKGQLIASLDTTKLSQNVSIAEADLRGKQSDVDKVLDDIRLWQYGNQGTTGETKTQQNLRERAESTRDQSYSNLQKARQDLNDASIFSPIDGVVVDLGSMEVGQNVSLTDSIKVANPQTLIFKALVDEADFKDINIGQRVSVKLDSFPDREFRGNVENIGISTETTASGGSAIPVEVSIEEDPHFVIGLSGEAEFIIQEGAKVLVVPKQAIKKEGNDSFVNILKNGKVVKQKVTVGIETDRQVQITQGLSEGDQVIIGGLENAKNKN